MSVCDRSKKSSGKTSVEGKNGRIDFSSSLWDKGIALSGITSESLKVHSCSPMSLQLKGLGKPTHIHANYFSVIWYSNMFSRSCQCDKNVFSNAFPLNLILVQM